jgi:hypothetical protein
VNSGSPFDRHVVRDYLDLAAIKLGRLFLRPRRRVETVLADYIGPLTMEFNGHVGLVGSYIRVANNGERFAVCTAHQVGRKIDNGSSLEAYESLRFNNFLSDKELVNLPIDSLLHSIGPTEEDSSDVLAFHVCESIPQCKRNAAGRYFELVNNTAQFRLASWAIGFPFSSNKIDYEPLTAAFTTKMIECSFDKKFSSNATHLMRFKLPREFEQDLNGMSGGAVFSLVRTQAIGQYEFVLDGVIVRGGNGSVYVIETSFIKRLAKRYLSSKI